MLIVSINLLVSRSILNHLEIQEDFGTLYALHISLRMPIIHYKSTNKSLEAM
ncbi:Uncharacterised protein [uncultured Prevotella sp.]|jgi:hypothetical protein|uniref:Uncharacterized protein n=1 Tax=Prevotella pallens TaxID=60133 RepID=A0A379G8N1_9BACT|nr:Uncharacterised protein [Prevotella pallens]VTY03154.1 Uncharacterised protein [uncultured Prevotella sp.]